MATEQLLNDKQSEKQEVKGYFETTGFDRWNRIYSESDDVNKVQRNICLLYTSPSPRDKRQSRMPSSA